MLIVKGIAIVLQALLSICLIVVVMSQTTKSEGLTGSIGGQVTPSFKGKPGMDEQIKTITIWVSAAWFAVSVVAALLAGQA
jgi:preprotein translocase subunit SecG